MLHTTCVSVFIYMYYFYYLFYFCFWVWLCAYQLVLIFLFFFFYLLSNEGTSGVLAYPYVCIYLRLLPACPECWWAISAWSLVSTDWSGVCCRCCGVVAVVSSLLLWFFRFCFLLSFSFFQFVLRATCRYYYEDTCNLHVCLLTFMSVCMIIARLSVLVCEMYPPDHACGRLVGQFLDWLVSCLVTRLVVWSRGWLVGRAGLP